VKLNKVFSELPRQELKPFLASYGVGWAIKSSVLREQKTFHPKALLGWPILREQAVDIDDRADFATAEALQVLAEKIDPAFRPQFNVKYEMNQERNL
jgi:CMP-N-acetylneuraminic acid synthetase